MVEIKEWIRTQRHSIIVYSDFESLLITFLESKSINTIIFKRHDPISYGLYVKALDDMSIELLEKYNKINLTNF